MKEKKQNQKKKPSPIHLKSKNNIDSRLKNNNNSKKTSTTPTINTTKIKDQQAPLVNYDEPPASLNDENKINERSTKVGN